MKTLGQLLSTIYDGTGLNVDGITNKLKNLPVSDTLQGVTSTVKNLTVYKVIATLDTSAQASSSIIGWYDDAMTDQLMDNGYSQQSLLKLAQNIATKFPNVGIYNIATILGRPIYLTVGENPNDHTLYYILDSRKGINSVTYFNEDNRGVLIEYSEGLGDYYVADLTGLFEVGNGKYADLSSLADQCDATANTTECLLNILNAATVTGYIEPNQVLNIINQYAPSDTLNQLRDYVVGLPALNKVSVTALVAKALSNAEGDYQEGDSYYTPYDTPTYVDDIISLIVDLAVALLPVILSVVFHSVALVIMLVGSAVSSIISYIREKTHLTTCEINRADSTLPIWNYPICTTSDISIDQFDEAEEIAECVQNYGCAALLMYGYGSPCVSLVFPQGKEEPTDPTLYTIQIMPAANSCSKHLTYPSYDYIFHAADQGQDPYIEFHKNDAADVDVLSVDPAATDYVYLDNNGLVTQLVKSIIYSGMAGNHTAPFDYTLPLSDNIQEYSYQHVIDVLDSDNILTAAQKRTILYAFFDWIVDDIGAYNDYGHVIGYDYSKVATLLSKPWIADGLAEQIASKSSIVLCGIDALTPTVQWPLLEKSTVIWACVLTAVSAAAVTAGALVLKRNLKRKAVARLSLRESEFENAKTAYQEDQSSENFAALNKANRKLTRAWNKAGRVGVSMYNGFSCGSSSDASLGEYSSSLYDANVQNGGSFSIEDVLKVISPKYQLQS